MQFSIFLGTKALQNFGLEISQSKTMILMLDARVGLPKHKTAYGVFHRLSKDDLRELIPKQEG